MLQNKKIILGVTGSIAAYKAAILVRLLVKKGAQVRVVMTPYAKEFITPLTLATLSNNPVLSEFFKEDTGDWNSHVDLGLWADAMLIAPATATTLGKMANGIADNLLITTYLSARCPVFIAPAMDLDMFAHPSTRANLEKLNSFENHIVDPGEGELASGLDGKGRMQEPELIIEQLEHFFLEPADNKNKLTGKKFLVTAGPTYEPIDPVRFIGNHSTGKMGYAIVNELTQKGAEVILISGPVNLSVSNSNTHVISVNTAEEMYKACVKEFKTCDGAILCAAVADFKPKNVETNKIKNKTVGITLELESTTDIAAELGKTKQSAQKLVGFALETNNELQNAKEKIKKKNFDFIILNSLNDKGAGFKTDTNKITIIDKDNNISKFELKSKAEVAKDIINKLTEIL